MAALTIDEIKALDFGYLTGEDLLNYCPFQIIQKQLIVDPTCLDNHIETAYKEVLSDLVTRYDIESEFGKTGTSRYFVVVKIVALSAIRNLTANIPGLPENMTNNFKWLDKALLDSRNGQKSLFLVKKASDTIRSNTEVIQNNFNTLG
jgi:hypothetical protein